MPQRYSATAPELAPDIDRGVAAVILIIDPQLVVVGQGLADAATSSSSRCYENKTDLAGCCQFSSDGDGSTWVEGA